tara:strand:+ start:2110 stop:2433 length:324 start_codon:yes stop_codon:yes gene_type:complete
MIMSDEAEVMEPEAEVNPMQTFVDDILAKNFAGAQTTFNDLLGDKLNDALDQEKVSMAQQVYNGEEPDEDQLELELDDDQSEEEYEDDLEDGAEEYTSETDDEEVED